MLWFKCAAMHDPVRPVLKRQAALGWEAKERQVDTVIERPMKAEDMLHRMKGWFTADVHRVSEIVREYDGFIEKYIGDAVLAVFGAVASSLRMKACTVFLAGIPEDGVGCHRRQSRLFEPKHQGVKSCIGPSS